MDFVKEKLRFDAMENVSFTTSVSAREPIEDGQSVLCATAVACCGRAETIKDACMAEGVVTFTAVLKDEEGRIRRVERAERFSVNEQQKNVRADDTLLLCASAEKVRVCAEAGQLLFSCRVVLSGTLVSPCETDYLIAPEDKSLRTLVKRLKPEYVAMAVPLRFTHEFETSLSPRMPEAREVLAISASAFAQEVHLSAGQLVLGGRIALQTIYRSDDEYEPVLQISDEEDFSQIIELTRSEENCRPIMTLAVEAISASLETDEQGEKRVIRFSARLCGCAVLLKSEEVSVLSDVYSLASALVCTREKLTVTHADETISQTFNRSVPVRLPDNKTPISRVSAVSFSPSLVFDPATGDVSGNAEAAVLYAASGTGETEGFNVTVPIAFSDVFKSVRGSGALGQIALTDMQAVPVSGRELEVRAGFKALLTPFAPEESEVVQNVTESERAPSEYGIIVYRVQKNESLWDICKQFGVDENDLCAMNPGLAGEPAEGDRLFVFRPLAG